MTDKILTTKQPEAGYYHVSRIEIDNHSLSIRWLFDERGVDTDEVLRRNFTDTTMTYDGAIADEDPRVVELAQRIYSDLRELSLIVTARKAEESSINTVEEL